MAVSEPSSTLTTAQREQSGGAASASGFAGVCPACGSPDLHGFLHIPSVPVFCNVLLDTQKEALGAPRADMDMALCRECGLISNRRFRGELVGYAPGYENSLHHSTTFQEYAVNLAKSLVARYDLVDRNVLEIGPGDGTFLRLMCDAGCASGIGYDPSHVEGPAATGDRVAIIRSRFPVDGSAPGDFVVCRHVLEHAEDPRGLLESLSHLRGRFLYIEVPNAQYMLDRGTIWDLIYEHHTYFTPDALRWLVEDVGMEVVEEGVAFGDQYAWLVARVSGSPLRYGSTAATRSEELLASCERLSRAYEEKVADWRSAISDDEHPTVWGIGSKGVTLLNLVCGTKPTRAVDVNPVKWGQYVPGTGHLVMAPEDLKGSGPGQVILTNGIYLDEVRAQLRELGIVAEVLTA